MKLRLLATIGLTVPSLASAQTCPPAPDRMHDLLPQRQGLIACAYNGAGQYTGADSANSDDRPGKPVRVGQGAQAWRLVIAAPDGTACPRRIELAPSP